MKTSQQVWDSIAPSWYRLRQYTRFGAELAEMAGRWREGRVLDIGCAHCPDLLPFQEGFELWAVDFSGKMLQLGQEFSARFGLGANLVQADARFLPFPDGAFDWAVAVAVYHHLQGEEARQQGFAELYRVLRKGGEAFITLWNRWQPRFWLRGPEVMLPWRSGGETVYRYYHLFTYPEAKDRLRQSGFEVIGLFPESSHPLPVKALSQNICALVRKGG